MLGMSILTPHAPPTTLSHIAVVVKKQKINRMLAPIPEPSEDDVSQASPRACFRFPVRSPSFRRSHGLLVWGVSLVSVDRRSVWRLCASGVACARARARPRRADSAAGSRLRRGQRDQGAARLFGKNQRSRAAHSHRCNLPGRRQAQSSGRQD